MSNPSNHAPARQGIVWTLLIVLILAAAGELAFRGFRRGLADMGDFAIIYASTRAFETGGNPYDYSAMRAASREAGHIQPDEANPEDLAVYPPTTYLLLSPLAWLDWANVRWAWLLLDLVGIAVLLVTMTRYAPGGLSPARAAFVAAFILGLGPIHTTIAKGQPAIVVTALLALAFVAEARGAVVWAAIFIGLAACLKAQMAAPVMLLYLFQRRWKPIAIVAAVTSGLLAVACLRMFWAGVSWLPSLVHNLSLELGPGGVYDPSPANPLAFQLINGSPLIHRFTSSAVVVALLLAAIGVLVCVFLWKRGQRCANLMADPVAFSAACVLGLVLIAHRYYDVAVLVFVFVWAIGRVSSWRPTPALISIAGCIVMAFPVSAFLISSGYSRAPFAIPQTLWDAVVIQQQSWLLLVILIALTPALTNSPERAR